MTGISAEAVAEVFGDGSEPIEMVTERAEQTLGRNKCIVWEGQPDTFQFLYVSKTAEIILGYPISEWKQDGFWALKVVHPDDRKAAVAYCALATGKGCDHDFTYRAVKADGSIVLLHDVVKVVLGRSHVPRRLVGIMIPLEDNAAVQPIFRKVT